MNKYNLENLKDKSIAMLGFGSENVELCRWLIKHKAPCRITILDQDEAVKEKYPEFNFSGIEWGLGKGYDKFLTGYDFISRVAGYPLFTPSIKKAIRNKVIITSPTKFFFEFCPSKNIIGVTGTKGKGTTSALIVEILSTAGKKVFWGGNIGIPMFSFIDKLNSSDWIVLELSSFQLEDLELSPHIAVLTNLQKEHLKPADPNNPNYHKSYKDYIKAKLRIFAEQSKDDFAVINKKIDFAKISSGRGKAILGRGKKVYFAKLDYPSRLVGEHNKENIAAAAAAANLAGVKKAVIKKAVKKFKGLEHRIEYIDEIKGNEYYDDSFATTPQAAITALDSFADPIILIAGGADKGSDFYSFAKLAKKKTKAMILFKGKGSKRIKKELAKIKYDKEMIFATDNMKDAVFLAKKYAKENDIILLSPACASFGVFKNYKERGDLFKEEVRNIL